jgi:hypothetical protein
MRRNMKIYVRYLCVFQSNVTVQVETADIIRAFLSVYTCVWGKRGNQWVEKTARVALWYVQLTKC